MKLAKARIAQNFMNPTLDAALPRLMSPKVNNFTAVERLSVNDSVSLNADDNQKT